MKGKFAWPRYPHNADEFESLMRAVDLALATEGLKPFQRPLHVPRKFWEAFGWGGNVLPSKELARQAGYTGDILMAKAHEWYEQTYGEQLKSDFALGHAPYRLGNATWRVRVGVVYGQVRLFVDRNLENRGVMLGSGGKPATFNTLCAIENFPKGLAERLPDHVICEYAKFYAFLFYIFAWRESLPRTELLDMARADYDASTAELIAHRYGQSRWAAQQAVEKTIKGILSLAGTEFPRGASGHDLLRLGDLLAQQHQIRIEPALISGAACSARVRYGEDPSTEADAYNANHAALGVLDQLRTNRNLEALISHHRVRG
jgi:HEPN domain-containing protein